MEHEPEIEFEILPRPAALRKFHLTEEECVDLVAEGLEAFLEALGASDEEPVPNFMDHVIQVGSHACRLGDLAEIEISGGSDVAPG